MEGGQKLDLKPFKILILHPRPPTPTILTVLKSKVGTFGNGGSLDGGQEFGMMPGENNAKVSHVSQGGALGDPASQSMRSGS